MNNRLNAEQIAMILSIVVDQYPFYAPMIFALYTLGLRYCHVSAMRSRKLGADGVIAIEESYDVSANVFSPVFYVARPVAVKRGARCTVVGSRWMA